MEENENKKPEENEPEAPEGAEEKPVEDGSESPEKERGGKLNALKGKAKVLKDKAKDKAKVVKQKTGEFMGVKRNRIIVLACSGAAIIALVVGLSVGLTQCHGGNGGDATSSSSSSGESKGGEGSGSSAHTHDYGTAWKSDATQHWHECSCGDKKDAANHTFGSEMEIITPASETAAGKKAYKCSVCSYLKGEVAYTPYISEANFADAFKFEGDKITVHCDSVSDSASFQDTETKNGNIVHCVSTGDGAVEYYYTVEGEGSDAKYYVYSKDSSGAWVKNRDDDKYYDVYSKFDANVSAFDSMLTYQILNLDKEKGCYTARYTNRYDTTVSAELYFNNGKIVKAIKSYDSVVRTYTFSEDASAIELPSNAHAHTFAPGTLDLNLNSSNAAFEVTCTSCNKTMKKERFEDDAIGTIFYGYYPQTRVKDSATITSLDAIQSAEGNGWYKLGEDYYAKATAQVYGSNGSFDDGDQIVDSQDYWFKVEPVEWKVLSEKDGAYSVVSNLLLDAHRYNDSFTGKDSWDCYANDYGNSDVRAWLNKGFFEEVFSLDDSRIKKVTVDNSAATTASSTNAYACGETKDNVYLLSYADYANASYFPTGDSRQCKLTDWARAHYAHDPSASSANPTHYGEYWTRSPSGDDSKEASFVDQDGVCTGTADVGRSYVSVRPVVTIKPPVTRDHQHKNPTSGSLDLNGGAKKLHGKCPVCDAKIVRDYDAANDKVTGFLYGYYPQTHVKDTETIASLKALAPESNGWYKLGDSYYAKAAGNPYTINSTGKFDDGDTITKDEEYWFSCDPIEWYIVSSSGSTHTLISSVLLDTHRFNEHWSGTGTAGHYSNNYKESEIRSWLNGDFYGKAFSKDSSLIQQVTVDNSAATTDEDPNSYACEDTQDKVCLLSYRQFCYDPFFQEHSSLETKTTDWARANGAFCYNDPDYVNNGAYWTRSPLSERDYYVLMVGADGYLSQYYVDASGQGVRPSITITFALS